MLIIVTIVIEIDIIMSHITLLPQWAITQCDELGGDAIIGLKVDLPQINGNFSENIAPVVAAADSMRLDGHKIC